MVASKSSGPVIASDRLRAVFSNPSTDWFWAACCPMGLQLPVVHRESLSVAGVGRLLTRSRLSRVSASGELAYGIAAPCVSTSRASDGVYQLGQRRILRRNCGLLNSYDG